MLMKIWIYMGGMIGVLESVVNHYGGIKCCGDGELDGEGQIR